MTVLLPPAVLQFADANGKPYAGGKIATYVPGTTTPKSTWSDPAGTSLNTNPITLDSAGRCIIYADGVVRTVLSDASGNLIWDQVTSTVISTAMTPVCSAPDIPTAQTLLGIVNNTATLAALAAAITTETANRTAADTAEATTRATADTTNASAITAETTRAEAAEAALAASIAAATFQSGHSNGTDANGHVRVTFPTPFANQCSSFTCSIGGGGLFTASITVAPDRLGADVWLTMPWGAAAQAGLTVYWIATGS
ncbi:MAG TPA: hypothetical protein VHU42_08210 [Rhodopila sp.]|jgi:hypothetical protein|nr:hypothetical protein [Rhodopila sp.]